MAVQSASVSVTTSATLLSGTEADSMSGQSIMLLPPSTIYVGPSGVTSANGYALTAGVEYSFDLQSGEALYGITASGTVVVPVLRIGV